MCVHTVDTHIHTDPYTHRHTHTFNRKRTDEAVGLILQVFLLASSPLNCEDISSLANLSFRQLWGSESVHNCIYEGVHSRHVCVRESKDHSIV